MRFEGRTVLYPVAIVCHGWKEPEDDANANLIAAAPALLEALRFLVSRASVAMNQSVTHDGLANCDALVKARAAIAKAEGRA
jgi:hypothetical protein